MNPANSANGGVISATSSSENRPQQGDFELRKLADGRWRLRANTCHGLHWMKSSDMQHDDGELHFNLMTANEFLRRARRQGLKTNTSGPWAGASCEVAVLSLGDMPSGTF